MKKLLLCLSLICGIYFSLSAQTCLTPVIDTVTHKSVAVSAISPYPTSFSWTHPVSSTKGTNTLLVIQVAGDVYADSVLNGTTMLTRLDTAGSGGYNAEVWYQLNPDTGANTISVYFPAGSGTFAAKKSAAAISFYNVDQATPFGTSAHGTGNTCPTSLVVKSGANQLVLDMIVKNYFYSPTSDPSQTKIYGYSNGNGNAVAGSTLAGADSVTFVWSWAFCSTYDWAAIGVPIMPACITSVNETQKDIALKIFPNPSSGDFMISLLNPDHHSVMKIYDLPGKEIYSETLIANQQTIHSKLSPGIYLVRINDQHIEYTQKIVVE